MDSKMDRWTDEQMNRWIYEQIDRKLEMQINRWIDKQIDRKDSYIKSDLSVKKLEIKIYIIYI